MGPLRNANATMLLASAVNSGSNVIFRLGIGVSQTRDHTYTNGEDANGTLKRPFLGCLVAASTGFGLILIGFVGMNVRPYGNGDMRILIGWRSSESSR